MLLHALCTHQFNDSGCTIGHTQWTKDLSKKLIVLNVREIVYHVSISAHHRGFCKAINPTVFTIRAFVEDARKSLALGDSCQSAESLASSKLVNTATPLIILDELGVEYTRTPCSYVYKIL